ncbi:MAG: HlyD family efflux transporter periplasmic adaptor subunit [Chitinophagaceae bacterium]|nr:HlyD family efflux transporter periplasmic adaptor subunit [Chitinophagaceae bacterium]
MLDHHKNTEDETLFKEVRSEEVQEIIGRIPSWITRNGIIVLFLIVTLLLISSVFLHYPDRVSAQINITSDNPPVKIVAYHSGRIKTLFVKQNDLVKKGSALFEMESTSNQDDLDKLKMELTHLLETNNINLLQQKNLNLGELQSEYLSLLNEVEEWNYFLTHENSQRTLSQMERELQDNILMVKQLRNNEDKIQSNLGTDKKIYDTDKELFEKGVLSEHEFLLSKKKYNEVLLKINDNQNKILEYNLRISELKKRMLDTELSKNNQLSESKRKVELSAKNLIQRIEEAKQISIYTSPISGKVNLFSIWKENQNIHAEQGIMLIVPEGQQILAKGTLAIQNSGKVKVGQKVLIELSSHPASEYGLVTGEISYISSAPMDSIYSFDIRLTHGLKTSNGNIIFQQPVLTGRGDILTENKSLFSRFIEKF